MNDDGEKIFNYGMAFFFVSIGIALLGLGFAAVYHAMKTEGINKIQLSMPVLPKKK